MVKDKSNDDEWNEAQAALHAAQELPRGPDRIDALKKAGQLRFDADQRRRTKYPEAKS